MADEVWQEVESQLRARNMLAAHTSPLDLHRMQQGLLAWYGTGMTKGRVLNMLSQAGSP